MMTIFIIQTKMKKWNIERFDVSDLQTFVQWFKLWLSCVTNIMLPHGNSRLRLYNIFDDAFHMLGIFRGALGCYYGSRVSCRYLTSM